MTPAHTCETHALPWVRVGASTPGWWHRGVVGIHVLAGGTASLGRLGGGGLGHFLLHLFIWRLIWRAGLGLWHVPVAGPFLVVLLIAGVAAVVILRRQRGPRWWSRGSPTGTGSGGSPRDW